MNDTEQQSLPSTFFMVGLASLGPPYLTAGSPQSKIDEALGQCLQQEELCRLLPEKLQRPNTDGGRANGAGHFEIDDLVR